MAPTSGVIESPPEYAPTKGVIFSWIPGHWNEVVRDCVVALTANPNCNDIAYVVCHTGSQATAASTLSAAGADMSKVVFYTKASNTLWIRDYGPHFIWQDDTLAIVDSHYYPGRDRDNFTPTNLGDNFFLIPTYDMGLYYSGGNFQPGPNGSAFVTQLVMVDNPSSAGFNQSIIEQLYQRFQGIETLHIFPQLPATVDGTGHIDMWLYLIDEDTCIISEFKPGSNSTAITITQNAVTYMQNLGFTVYRTPAWHSSSTHWTYTNAFRVNNRIFIPTYNNYPADSATALAVWQTAAGPGIEIVPIVCDSIIPAAGAIHCIVMQVPRYTLPAPSAYVVWPDGGQMLAAGSTRQIQWAATDTDNAVIPQVDLYYSVDDGGTWQYIATTTNSGKYDWVIPDADTPFARIKVVAHSAGGGNGVGISTGPFRIAPMDVTVYDFSTGAGVDKIGYGYQTLSWTNVDGVRSPVTTQISSLVTNAYQRLAFSDATSGDNDANRYIAPTPSSSYESTHIFEFTIQEDPDEIDEIEVFWEGYGDDCAQIELYVWDYLANQWTDGQGQYGINAYIDNFAGNTDTVLTGVLRPNLNRFISAQGKLTFMLYVERPGVTSFHDYMAVHVKQLTGTPLIGDVDGDGDVDIADLAALLAGYGACSGDPDYVPAADFDDSGCIDIADLAGLLANYGIGK